jgi:hypothetical protein
VLPKLTELTCTAAFGAFTGSVSGLVGVGVGDGLAEGVGVADGVVIDAVVLPPWADELNAAADERPMAASGMSSISAAAEPLGREVADADGSRVVRNVGGAPDGTAIRRGDGAAVCIWVGCAVGGAGDPAAAICGGPRPSLSSSGEKRATTHSEMRPISAADPIMNATMTRFESNATPYLGRADPAR